MLPKREHSKYKMTFGKRRGEKIVGFNRTYKTIPITGRGSIVEVFSDMTVWLGIRAIIEQINNNASAA